MLRREFLAVAAGTTATTAAGAAVASEQVVPAATAGSKQVFRSDGKAWREIAWEEAQPGEWVLILDVHEGVLIQFAGMKVIEHRVINGIPAIYGSACFSRLPPAEHATSDSGPTGKWSRGHVLKGIHHG